MKENPNYFAIIPANVRYDKELRANEKLMYGEITALSNKTGECWASNQYFADLYGVTPQAVSKWISNLRKKGYLDVEITYKEDKKEIDKRIIRIVSTNDYGVSTNDYGVSTNDCGGINKSLIGYKQKIKDNNTSNNNTRDNINKGSVRKQIKIEFGDDETLENAFLGFVDMRERMRKPLTARAYGMIKTKLAELADRSRWAEILDQSVFNSWQGVYPLKEDKSKPAQSKYINYDQRDFDYNSIEEILLNR